MPEAHCSVRKQTILIVQLLAKIHTASAGGGRGLANSWPGGAPSETVIIALALHSMHFFRIFGPALCENKPSLAA
jgi:hypothetical protein